MRPGDRPPASGGKTSHRPTRTARGDLLMLLAAAIWGFAFVAQRIGMEHVGPFLFNAVRFTLGTLVLLPFLGRLPAPARADAAGPDLPAARPAPPAGSGPPVAGPRARRVPAQRVRRSLARGGLLAGVLLFGGISLQQMGLVYTTAGKAGFITGLYVVIVPLLALIWGQRAAAGQWVGTALATVGLYLLCITGRLAMDRGDLLVLGGALFWALHVHAIAWLTRELQPVRLACAQFAVCAALSLLMALLTERIELSGVRAASVPILYAGVLSVGVAYTLQVIAQRDAHPAHAAILLSLEAVFAVAGGMIFLAESLTVRGAAGCALMLGGMLASQLSAGRPRSRG